ncbi:hypothetical protein AMELA_G00025550 [Ameiurus melas]|uniref:Uncharacterized protein n=1 Tax=Ameiurus melas TaxID=219545 RepID=A0A7J6BCJ7_AMEME|nr:hypothetical protein AMELA_G00025550 [Ameiurus melas]
MAWHTLVNPARREKGKEGQKESEERVKEDCKHLLGQRKEDHVGLSKNAHHM